MCMYACVGDDVLLVRSHIVNYLCLQKFLWLCRISNIVMHV